MDTLALNTVTWDLTLDVSGNVATTSGDAAILQDVASACRLFIGELWYDTTRGIPYFQNVLGQYLPTAFLKAALADAALAVPGVTSASAVNLTMNGRTLSGQIEVTTSTGTQTVTL